MRIQPEIIVPNTNHIDQTKRSEDINNINYNNQINFNTFQSSVINLHNEQHSKSSQLPEKSAAQQPPKNDEANHIQDSQQVQHQQRGFKKKESMRQRLCSDATALSCWLCNELPKPQDPFVNNCKCAGSNHIHAMCLVKLVEEELKTKKKNVPQTLSKKNKNQHECSICKYKYKSELVFKFTMNLRITLKNIWFVVFGLFSLFFSVAMMVISYLVFIKKSDSEDGSSMKDIYVGFVIFLGILCVIIFLSFFLLAFFMFYKAFVKLIPQYIKLISDIKDKIIIGSYDPYKNIYFYNQSLNIYPSKCNALNIPNTNSTCLKSPFQTQIQFQSNKNNLNNKTTETKSPQQCNIIKEVQAQYEQPTPIQLDHGIRQLQQDIENQNKESENQGDDFNILRTFG